MEAVAKRIGAAVVRSGGAVETLAVASLLLAVFVLA